MHTQVASGVSCSGWVVTSLVGVHVTRKGTRGGKVQVHPCDRAFCFPAIAISLERLSKASCWQSQLVWKRGFWQSKTVAMRPSQTRREVSSWEIIGHAEFIIYSSSARWVVLELKQRIWRAFIFDQSCSVCDGYQNPRGEPREAQRTSITYLLEPISLSHLSNRADMR